MMQSRERGRRSNNSYSPSMERDLPKSLERDLPKSMERDLPQSMERDLPNNMERDQPPVCGERSVRAKRCIVVRLGG